MKKRIISAILSMATVISTVTALTSNASPDWYWGRLDEEKIAETFGDCTLLEGHEWLGFEEDTKYIFLSNKNTDTGYVGVYEVYRSGDSIGVRLNAATDLEPIKEKIKQLDSSLELRSYIVERPQPIQLLHINSDVILPETAKKIREIVGNDISEFGYSHNKILYQTIYYDYITRYCVIRYQYDEETQKTTSINIEDTLLEYAEAHSDIFDVVRKDDYFIDLVPKKDVTQLEHIQLAKDIMEATGCYPDGISPESVNPPINEINLDLIDYVEGDANRDKVLTIADAAAIFQSLANPDKYALSAQGEFNADFACDGITVDDAVRIQKKLAGIK